LFFGAQGIDLAFLEIVVLWGMVLIVAALSWLEVRAAGMLMLPFVLCVAFEVYLNFALWQLNLGFGGAPAGFS